jgi:Antibiotic biosynthesis monooxygenase
MPHIRTDNQPVTQITVIELEQGKQAEALSLMTERARFLARQPGFISISLHRSLDGASSTTSNGRVAISCSRLINHRNSARSGVSSIS